MPDNLLHNQIYHSDCLTFLRSLPDNCVDVSFADPPFSLKKKYSTYKDNPKEADYLAWCKDWITEMVRVTKPTGSILLHNIPKWLTHYAGFLNTQADFLHWIAWDAGSTPRGKKLFPTHYGILLYAKDKKQHKFYEVRMPHKRCRKCLYLQKDYGGKKKGLHPFGPLIGDVWTDLHRVKHAGKRDKHPCQLPYPLLERIILMCSDEGNIILDPFMGTGTTAICAKKLGRVYLGSDLDLNYLKIANEKLSKTQSDSSLNGIWVSQYLGRVATLRDRDWKALAGLYDVPEDITAVDREEIDFRSVEETLFDVS